MSDGPIRVLFVCTHNSARSQIAEALLRDYGRGDFEVFSAGTEVAQVNPYAVQVLGDLGIDWSGARSKSITEFLSERFDYVITVCDRARETCPVFPGSENTLHWGLDDPSEVEGTDEEKLAAFRQTQLEVSTRLRPFMSRSFFRRRYRPGPRPDHPCALHARSTLWVLPARALSRQPCVEETGEHPERGPDDPIPRSRRDWGPP